MKKNNQELKAKIAKAENVYQVPFEVTIKGFLILEARSKKNAEATAALALRKTLEIEANGDSRLLESEAEYVIEIPDAIPLKESSK